MPTLNIINVIGDVGFVKFRAVNNFTTRNLSILDLYILGKGPLCQIIQHLHKY